MKKNFTMSELCRSNSYPNLAAKELPIEIAENLCSLIMKVLQPLRDAMQFPIIISSGYRPPALNKAVNGATNSWHQKGLAADIACGVVKNRKIYDWLQEKKNKGEIPIIELLWEGNGGWVHVAIRSPV